MTDPKTLAIGVNRLHNSGMTYHEIGEAVGLSGSTLNAIANEHLKAGRLSKRTEQRVLAVIAANGATTEYAGARIRHRQKRIKLAAPSISTAAALVPGDEFAAMRTIAELLAGFDQATARRVAETALAARAIAMNGLQRQQDWGPAG